MINCAVCFDVSPCAATDAKMLKRGVKEVVKALRKGSKG